MVQRQLGLQSPVRRVPAALARITLRPVVMPLAIAFLFTGSLVGIGAQSVRAAPAAYTIFATSTLCPDNKQFDWEGSTSHVFGSVHSNAGLFVSGNAHTTTGSATYAAACGVSVSGDGNAFGPSVTASPAPFQAPPIYPAPTCTPDKTFTGNKNIAEEAVAGVLSGVYCVLGGKLDLSGPVSGSVTLYSDGAIVLSGSGLNLTPFANGVLVHSTLAGPDALTVSSSSS